ncbi:MAG: hypothetical protein JWQ43_4034 [Glaciihabitans sp.]|nr:hypothetical protein [Glaciihabitans sp.]
MATARDPQARDRTVVRRLIWVIPAVVVVGVIGTFVLVLGEDLEPARRPALIMGSSIFLALIVAPAVWLFRVSSRGRVQQPGKLWNRAVLAGVISLAVGFLGIVPSLAQHSSDAIADSRAVARGPGTEEIAYGPEELDFVSEEVAADSISTLGGLVPIEQTSGGLSGDCTTSNLQPGIYYFGEVRATTTDSPEAVIRNLTAEWESQGLTTISSANDDDPELWSWIESSTDILDELEVFIRAEGLVSVQYETVCVVGTVF